MNEQPYTWKTIEYLEKPATSDEKAIAVILEELLESFVTGDISYLASVISEDATMILSQENPKLVTKIEYLEKMSKIVDLIRVIKYKNVLIRMNSGTEASVSCVRYIRFQNSREEFANRLFEFKKFDDIWKIAKVVYLTREYY